MAATSYYFEKTLVNQYLNTTKYIKAKTKWELEIKEQEILKRWAEQEKRQRERVQIENLKAKTEYMDSEAKNIINEYNNILRTTLEVDDKLNWEQQLRNEQFHPFVFSENEPDIENINREFNVPQKTILEKLFTALKKKREDLEEKSKNKYDQLLKQYQENRDEAYTEYICQKAAFEKEQNEFNESILQWRNAFESGDPDAIEKYVSVVFENSEYPVDFNKEYEIQYDSNSKSLIVSYFVPNQDQIPSVTGYKYINSSKSIKPIDFKKKDFDAFYENIILQVALRTVHEIFEAIYTNHVEIVVFNAWVNGIDKATGNEFTSCILSLQANREEFEPLNLNNIDPKACVKQLKGLIAGPLSQLAPVRPIMDINKEDKRFIESKDVLADLNSIENLAVMDWGDFEHLVRQLFEKMFTETGVDVKVTQASRDGGVDAVAFDPNPITGGKYVIQAKRYNNVVPVSAARDLYGTVINEGASKGILVTTSHFGNDTREFVKDKPISLIDGSNLVYLFDQYGYKVKIDRK